MTRTQVDPRWRTGLRGWWCYHCAYRTKRPEIECQDLCPECGKKQWTNSPHLYGPLAGTEPSVIMGEVLE